VLSGRGLCDGLITCPEESYRLWCVVVCDLETSRMRRPWPELGRSVTGKKKCHQRRDPRTEANEHKTRVLISSTIICKTFLILRVTERDIIINVCKPSCKVPVILVRF